MVKNRHTSNHRRNILRFMPWILNKAEKGMIMEIWYEDKAGNTDRHYILVLNPRYRYPGEKDWKIHAIKLNELPVKSLNLLADTYGIKYIPNLQRYKAMDVLKLIQEISSQRFYRKEVKTLMKRHPSYRTYLIKNISKVNLLDYKFDDDIEKKYLKILTETEQTTNQRHVTK